MLLGISFRMAAADNDIWVFRDNGHVLFGVKCLSLLIRKRLIQRWYVRLHPAFAGCILFDSLRKSM